MNLSPEPGPSGVDFIKVGHTAQNIEIALSICALHLRPAFEKLFSSVRVQRKAQKISGGCKTVYEIDLKLVLDECYDDDTIKMQNLLIFNPILVL